MAIQGAAADAHERSRIRYRPSPLQQLPFAFFAVAMIGMGLATEATGQWPLLFVLVSLAAEWGYLAFGAGITLTPERAVVHNLRRRAIRWSDVQGVAVENFLGSRTIVIYRTGGGRVRLRAPITGFLAWDRRFDEKFHTIGQWWLAHRGPDWAPGIQAGWAQSGAGQAGSGQAESAQAGWTQAVWVQTEFARRDGTPWVRPADRPRLRPPMSQAVPVALLLAVLGNEAGLAAFYSGPDAGLRAPVTARIVAALVLVVLLAGIRQFGWHGGITLTPDHADVHNLRRRRLRWSVVEDVAVEHAWSGSRIVIRERSGRRTRLSSPRIGLLLWDRDFADKAWAVHRCWQAASRAAGTQADTGAVDRAATGRAVSSAAFLPPGGYGDPALWKKVLVGLACVALAYELFVGLLVMALFAAFGS